MRTMITKRITAFARFCAFFLGRKSQNLSRFKKKLYLFLFCGVSGGISTIMVLHTLSRGRGSPPVPQRAPIPRHIGRTNEIRVRPSIPETTYKHIEFFRKYMDSLSREDKEKYEEILGARPGLMDSIMFLEKLYLSQSKNK